MLFLRLHKAEGLIVRLRKNIIWLNFKENISIYQYTELFMWKEILCQIQINHNIFRTNWRQNCQKTLEIFEAAVQNMLIDTTNLSQKISFLLKISDIKIEKAIFTFLSGTKMNYLKLSNITWKQVVLFLDYWLDNKIKRKEKQKLNVCFCVCSGS